MLRRAMSSWKPRYFDIGVNFSDSMFQGRYNGSATAKHPADIEQVIARAKLFNVNRMLITASSIEESRAHLLLVAAHLPNFASTAGVHPCTVAEEFYGGIDNEAPLENVEEKLLELKNIALEGHEKGLVKSFGEIGLDYDRLHYSTRAQQREMFTRQLQVYAQVKHLKMPLFLHMRAACDDFVELILPFLEDGSISVGNGVVHSFTGTKEELEKILKLGFFIGINGCSLKTQENVDVAKLIPPEKLMIETDAPWCEIRKSHASYPLISPYPSLFYPEISVNISENVEEDIGDKKKPSAPKNAIKLDAFLPFPSIKKENFEKHKLQTQQRLESLGEAPSLDVGEFAYPLIKSRNEPVFVGQVAEIMAKLHGLTGEAETRTFVDTIYTNSCTLFNM
ncbi:TatD DNase family protein [Metschnikowia aff. pulcherrima]|uniref:TatD DNase family protein n=1 Tax=Metschnikowia aff. pulcherrima TaxID=2163413 RepID=A0A4P6XVX9_9ASCO|nr:TatD DNase family protein [Metschnikowia aff. pulcherrima]